MLRNCRRCRAGWSSARRKLLDEYRHLPEAEQLPVVTELNILCQIDNLHTHPSVRQALQEDLLKIHGWV
jgi:carbonic anhydrase